MRRRGDRVKIISGKYSGRMGTIESNVYQRTMDYPDDFTNWVNIMLGTDELVTVRWAGGYVLSARLAYRF